VESKIKKLKEKLSYKKELLKNYIIYLKNRQIFEYSSEKKKVILMGTPEYGNLGDHLIAYAEKKLLGDVFGENNILEITENDIRYRMKKVASFIDTDSLLVLQGGGNISDVWEDQENIRNIIINKFPLNKIIIMPQTVYVREKAKIPVILDKYADNILFCAREKFTYDLLKRNGKKNICLVPDVACYLWKSSEKYRIGNNRKGIGVCLRKDTESIIGEVQNEIYDYLNRNNLKYENFDTVKDRYIPCRERKQEVEEILKYISTKELIITDRLHAMIMAYLTGTSCIVFANSNRKIEGTFEWISDVQNIFFTKDIREGLSKVEKFLNKRNLSEFKYTDIFYKIFEEVDN